MIITRHELYSTAIVLVLAAAILLAMPFSAFSFRPRCIPATGEEASASFVVLTAEERAAALKSARTAWQSEASETSAAHIHLPLTELPEEEQGALLTDDDLHCEEVPHRPVAMHLPTWQPSFKAPAPIRLEPEKDQPSSPTFSREEMLRM